MEILLAILMLSVIIIMHEGGHALAAILFGVKVKRFAIGFGSPVWSYKCRAGSNIEEFAICPIPLGGYMKPDEEQYRAAKPWHRVIICLSGPFANLIPLIAASFILGGGFYDALIYPVYTMVFGWCIIIKALVIMPAAEVKKNVGGPVMVVSLLKGWQGFILIS